MPLEGSVGHSKETAAKQEDFEEIQLLHARIVGAIIDRNPWACKAYHYVDLTAGKGKAAGIDGSPLIFLRNMRRLGREFRAWLIEKDPQSLASLESELLAADERSLEHIRLIGADYADGIYKIGIPVRGLPGCAYGLVYVDPNGQILPVKILQRLIANPAFARIDILAYVSATTYKRVRKTYDSRPTLSEHLHGLGKKYLYIREPHAKNQWTFVFLTNWSGYPEMKRIGFHRVDSRAGQQIIDRLDYTTNERQGRDYPSLFDAWEEENSE